MSTINIISPESFRTIPWKNGKGVTTELAININGTLTNFDWRLSIAEVAEDGLFSDFSGYLRNLILIEGNGINLHHSSDSLELRTDRLLNLLDYATFDGGFQTFGELRDGAIQDFNLMTREGKYKCSVETWTSKLTKYLPVSDLNFIFSLSGETQLSTQCQRSQIAIRERHLA